MRRSVFAALLVIIIPLALYLAVTTYWRTQQYNAITGDEPHFLLIADSLSYDHDVSLVNNYERETPMSIELGSRLDSHDTHHLINQLPILGIGLPLLLTLPYVVGGVNGAKFFLAFLIGLTLPLIVLTTILPIIKRLWWAVLVTLAIVCALPFLAASNQIYSDLVAGVVILHATTIVVGMYTRKQLSPHNALVLGIELAFLPWLYYRYIPPAIVLLAGALWIVLQLPRDRALNAALWVSLGLIFCSLASLAVYNYAAFGNLLGMFRGDTVSHNLVNIVMVFLGLHWDSLHGMFIQHPFLGVALLGIVPFAVANWRAALLVAFVYLTCVVPSSLHPNWYGGASFGGRYTWDAVGLWIFPLAYAVAALLQYRFGQYVLTAICALSFLWQGALASIWLTHNHFLYNNGFDLPIWAIGDFDTALLHLNLRAQYLLPSFRNTGYYFLHVPNYLVVLMSVLLGASGAYLCGALKQTRVLATSWGAFAIIAMLSGALYTPVVHPIVFNGSQLPGMVGDNNGIQRVAVRGKAGYLVYGPYLRIFPGRTYSLMLTYATGKKVFANYDLALDYGQVVIAKDRLPSAQTNRGIWHRTFVVPPPEDGLGAPAIFEFRVFYEGRGDLNIERLEIEPQD